MKPPKPSLSPESAGIAPIPDATIAAFLERMHQLLLKESPAEDDIALTGQLNRRSLDFSLDSLHEIDRYLNAVHDNAEGISGLPLLSTIWTIAMYVGEVIRQGAPNKDYQWVSVGEPSGSSGETTISYPDLGAVRALRARDGDMCMPSRTVLLIILRGGKARSICSFARAAMGRAGVIAKAVSPSARSS